MYAIARRLGVSLQTLIVANFHIPNPNLIYPGDVLCVPIALALPCCVVLRPVAGPLPDAIGAAVAYTTAEGRQSVSVVAALPPPSTFGAYDLYVAEVLIPDIGGFGNQLFPTPESPPTWATTLEISPLTTLTPGSSLRVMPGNSTTGASGPVVLSGTLASCRA
jgi:hypothetical protein